MCADIDRWACSSLDEEEEEDGRDSAGSCQQKCAKKIFLAKIFFYPTFSSSSGRMHKLELQQLNESVLVSEIFFFGGGEG